jgi:diaminohydroxyphosphoribosylaminopyrimidine deaminase / 5-amino-6-(5-phosphoribosylamino)uracil reductase
VKILLDNNRSSAEQIADYLFNRGIQSLFVEGGAEVINHFIEEGLWDEARIFTGRSVFGGGVKAPDLKGMKIVERIRYGKSDLDIYFRKPYRILNEIDNVNKN